ncbi:uncharacterized protein LOC116006808 [Ipomoea triloba]|uniref:uncharacterized protein LOC116006808 n=1 Tax=Ipomoea triloba TaxID=35885 RepID=UPI00125D65CA|nr:uncharacterized protein LOC116006808 [Ipomoea triloba]
MLKRSMIWWSVMTLLLLSSSFSANKHGVLGGRFLQHQNGEHQLTHTTTTSNDDFVTVNREVPSSPDPLHNSSAMWTMVHAIICQLEVDSELGPRAFKWLDQDQPDTRRFQSMPWFFRLI